MKEGMKKDWSTFLFMVGVGVTSSLIAVFLAERLAAAREAPRALPSPVAPGQGTA